MRGAPGVSCVELHNHDQNRNELTCVMIKQLVCVLHEAGQINNVVSVWVVIWVSKCCMNFVHK